MFLVRSFDGPSLCSTNPNSLTFCFKLWQFQIKSDRTYNTYRYFHLFSAQVFNKLRATWQTGSFLFDSCSAVKRLLGNESTSARIKADLTAYVKIQFTQPTSTSHLLNLASCFVSLPLSVSLFFWLPQDLSHVSASSALDQFLFLWLSCDGDPMCFVFARNSQDNFFKCIYIYICAGYFALGAKMLVSQYLVQFGSVHVSGAKHFVFDNFLSDG